MLARLMNPRDVKIDNKKMNFGRLFFQNINKEIEILYWLIYLVFRSTKIRPRKGIYKKPVVKLDLLLPNEKVVRPI